MDRTRLRGARAVAPRWTWPPDKWDRLSRVAQLVGSAGTVLDVGGRGHEMQRLLSSAEVTSLNVEEPADVVVVPGSLPYADHAYDVVTSCDVLEHIAPAARPAHVAELVRVARWRVVACFPCGSPEKDAAERRLADELRRVYDVRFDFLNEHLEHGLPRPADISAMARDADPSVSVTVWFQNGIEEPDRVLIDAVRARHRGDPRALARFVRAWVRRPRPELTTAEDPTNNRAYVAVDRVAPEGR